MVRVDSLRKRLYDMWVENPYVTAKKACEKLKNAKEELKDYYDWHGSYINKLLSEFRSYYSFGSPQEAHLPRHRVFEWENIPRPSEVQVGWEVVANRNNMWVFKKDARGSVHWYQEGLVRLYLKGELQLAKAKELFCRAFSWFSPSELRKYLDVPLKETYKKWTFELGSPVPRFDIRQFERSHGLRIFTDGSDPRALHVGESTPFWLDEQRQATAELGSVVQQFGVEIQEHMRLIRLWQQEARGVRKAVPRRPARRLAPSQRTIFEWLL